MAGTGQTTPTTYKDTEWCGKNIDGGGLPGLHDFRALDEHAKKATKDDASTFAQLREYLEKAFPSDPTTHDLFLVRGLLVWLTHKQETNDDIRLSKSLTAIETGIRTDVDKGPLELLYGTDTGQISIQDAFHALCTHNGIQSMLITGTTRALVGYEPGSQGVRDTWNAVRIDDKWQLIHPVLAAVSTSGHVTGGWIQKEDDGMVITKKEHGTHGKNRIDFRSYWFCPNPLEFAYFCHPDNSAHQFVSAACQVKTLKKFLAMPCVYPPYFKQKMDIVSKRSCILKSDGRRVQISFRVPKGRASKLNVSYKLYVEDTKEMEAGLKDITERLVLNARDVAKDTFSFEIRFPIEGTYKLEIFTTEFTTKQRCCVFKIKCTQRTKDFRKLPIDPGPNGWGFIPKAQKFGLSEPSNTAPKLQIKPLIAKEPLTDNPVGEDDRETDSNDTTKPEIAKNVDLSFDIDPKALEETEYNSVLYSSDFIDDDHDDLQKHVSTNKDAANHKLHVNATVPCEGEFALVVEAADTGSDFEPVCSYLLTTLDSGSDEVSDDDLDVTVDADDDDDDGELNNDTLDSNHQVGKDDDELHVDTITFDGDGDDVNHDAMGEADVNADDLHVGDDDDFDDDVRDIVVEDNKEDGEDSEWFMNDQCIYFLLATGGIVALYACFEIVVRLLMSLS